ncbi:MAG: M20 family metallopeptidase [Spirochaetales bacterium]|nr:M20 family metallopeptidase [Spirochaetales bacterium]
MLNKTEKNILSLIDREEITELTRKLVTIDSVPRLKETESAENSTFVNTEKEVVLFIADWIKRELGITPEVEEVVPGRDNIIATVDSGKQGPVLMLEGHTDVVSEGDADRWQYGPFSAALKDGKIYGRGSCDMKAGLAVNLISVKALLKSKADFKGKIRLGFVCDEEGMMIGIKDFIKKGHADDVTACLVPEPEENQLCITMKGAIRAVVRVTGKMAHGAMPLTGINPNTRLARIILAFEEYEKEEKERCGSDTLVGYPSITFTVVQAPPAGTTAQLNVMPGEAVGYVDIRTTPCQNHDKIRKKLKEILQSLAQGDPDFKAEIEFIEDRPVVTMEKDEPIVKYSAEAYREITGKEPVYNGVPGATDGTFLRAWKGIPSLVNGPGPRHMPHQYNEYVGIEELYESALIYALTEYRFLK